MELYLDSANLEEIKEAFELGFIYGLTTTPTFMHRDGVTNTDELILQLADIVPVLQVEALGNTSDEIVAEAHRLLKMGLDKENTVFKIPISMIGAKACKQLVDEGIKVNLHLIYTLQQAYIAMNAGATYICPLVGRLQDQGHDALSLVEQCIHASNYYGYNSKIMFSSVRYPEHVRNAINLGVDACTIPWKVMKQLTDNHFTAIGTQEFVQHTRMITMKVKDIMRTAETTISKDKTILDAMLNMTNSKLGAVTVLNEDGTIYRIFTDGDLRRLVHEKGGESIKGSLKGLPSNSPTTINENELLLTASDLIKKKKVDSIIVVSQNKPVGMIDIQDLLTE